MAEISIFGSKARGEARTDSDLDVLVVIREGDGYVKEALTREFDSLVDGYVTVVMVASDRRELVRCGNATKHWHQRVEGFKIPGMGRSSQGCVGLRTVKPASLATVQSGSSAQTNCSITPRRCRSKAIASWRASKVRNRRVK